MKKIFALTLSAIMAVSMFGCSEDTSDSTNNSNSTDNKVDTQIAEETVDSSFDDILEKGKFVLGLDDTFPPMGFRNEDNEIVGFDIDLATAVCEKLDIELVLQPIDWSSKELELDAYAIDCIWNGMSINPSRQEAMNMTDAYLANEMVFIVRGASDIVDLSGLEGGILAVQSGSSAQEALEANTDLVSRLGSIVEFDSNLTALLDLETAGVDVVLMDSVVGRYQIEQSGKDFIILEETLSPEFYGIGFRKNDIALGDAVWNALVELKEEGVITEISTTWFGEDVTLIK